MMEKKFKELVDKKEVVFLAGSGISYMSKIPSAYDILSKTGEQYLPQNISNNEKEIIYNNIQPEVFYENLLLLTNNEDCLSAWYCLLNDFEPNINHYFITKYSNEAKLPIITTNFDLMFEKSAEQLGIHFKQKSFNDNPIELGNDSLNIIHLHGSINDRESIKTQILTTMTDITKINIPWIKYITNLMRTKYLCIVGYSGRDIDIFPFLASFSKKDISKPIIWINKFINNDYSIIASEKCKHTKINKYPNEIFEKMFNIENTNDSATNFNFLGKNICITEEEKNIFFGICQYSLGNYNKAYKIFHNIELNSLKSLYTQQYLNLFKAKLSHEKGFYFDLYNYSNSILQNNILKFNNISLQARFLKSESYRMKIPTHMYFDYPNKIEYFIKSLFVILYFIYTSMIYNFQKKIIKNLTITTKHDYIEHKIRFYAFIQSITKTEKNKNKFLVNFLKRKWHILRTESYKQGYASGIANCEKFNQHITNEFNEEGYSIYSLIGSSTGKELLLRNKADSILFEELNFKEAKKIFQELERKSQESGNLLNELKAILAQCYINILESRNIFFNIDKQNFLKKSILVQSDMWQKLFQNVLAKSE